MIFPFVSRERLDEAKQRIMVLESDNKRYHDLILKHGLGFALLEPEKHQVPDEPERKADSEQPLDLRGVNPAHTARKVSAFLQEQFNKGSRRPAAEVIAQAIAEGEAQAQMKHALSIKQNDQPTDN